MDTTRELGRLLLILGIVLAVAGVLLYFSGRLPFRLGHLPGDIVHRGEHTTFYLPITTSILLSIGLSLILWTADWRSYHLQVFRAWRRLLWKVSRMRRM